MYPSVPYGECFRVETHYSIAIVDGSAKIVVTSGVRWLKSTWWKSFIAQGVESESRTSFELWARLVKAQWQERLQEQARGRAAESAAEGASDGATEEAGEELAQSAPVDGDGVSEAREQPHRTPRSPPASPKRAPAPSAGADDPAASLRLVPLSLIELSLPPDGLTAAALASPENANLGQIPGELGLRRGFLARALPYLAPAQLLCCVQIADCTEQNVCQDGIHKML